ncbi:MAG: metal ABC transporter solute-binding protein, Zn/Mn family [bacterium]
MLKLFLTLIAFSITCFSCSFQSSEKEKSGALNITVSILPQKFIVEKIGGDKVNINVMVPPAASPETYEPDTRKMVLLKESAIYFLIGMPFEVTAFEKIKDDYKETQFVSMSKGIDLSDDPHIWLAPHNLLVMAENTVSALIKKDPANKGKYVKNLVAFKSEIHLLHDELIDLFKGDFGSSFVVYHPAWGHFSQKLGIKQIALEVEGKEPSAAKIGELTDFIKRNGVKYVFMQPQSSNEIVKALALETGVEIKQIDPLKENIIENIKESALLIKQGLVRAKSN